MNIVVIGSGNVATHLSIAIHASAENITQVYSPNLANATALAKLVLAQPINDISAIDLDADLYIISVKDDAIAEVASYLKLVKGLVVHTAGTVAMDVLQKHLSNVGVLYPLQTFSKQKAVNFKEIPLFLETSLAQSMPLLLSLAHKISDKVYELSGEKRKVLHLAAVFACNFTNHMYAIADDLLEENGLDFDMIKPLIAETNSKILNHKPAQVQTGPAIRKDEQTMNKQIEMLKNQPNLVQIYQILSENIKITLK